MTFQPTHPLAPAIRPEQGQSRTRRAVMGGKWTDLGRLPRYAAFAILGGILIWAPITGYLKTAPAKYKSEASLILPGSGASASLNLNGIGQASSYANSAFASNSVSPTETYKRLLSADRILRSAAVALSIDQQSLDRPRVELVDQTSLIHIEITGGSPIEAQARAEAILTAFFAELDALRADEVHTREDSGLQAIADYQASVARTRDEIIRLQDESGLLSIDQYDVLLDRHLALEARILDQTALVSEKTARVAAYENRLGVSAENAAATLKLFADGAYLTMISDLAGFEAELAEANAHYGPSHPKVLEARQARNSTQDAATALAIQVTGLPQDQLSKLDLAPQGDRATLLAELVALDTDRLAAEQELTTLQKQLSVSATDLQTKSVAAATLQDLDRDFAVAEAVFASAIARAQSSKSDVYASYPLVQVLENPSLADAPSSPNRKLALAAGIAATFMMLVGLLLAWFRLALLSRLITHPEAVST